MQQYMITWPCKRILISVRLLNDFPQMKAHVDRDVYVLCQEKLAEFGLLKDPNFRWCANVSIDNFFFSMERGEGEGGAEPMNQQGLSPSDCDLLITIILYRTLRCCFSRTNASQGSSMSETVSSRRYSALPAANSCALSARSQ